jgi:hypothetical protein
MVFPPLAASSNTCLAGADRRGSPKRYQITAWVSATATITRCHRVGNFPTFRVELRRYLLLKEQHQGQPIRHTGNDAVVIAWRTWPVPFRALPSISRRVALFVWLASAMPGQSLDQEKGLYRSSYTSVHFWTNRTRLGTAAKLDPGNFSISAKDFGLNMAGVMIRHRLGWMVFPLAQDTSWFGRNRQRFRSYCSLINRTNQLGEPLLGECLSTNLR